MLSRGTLSPSKHVNSQVVAGRGHGLRGATAAAAAAAAAAATQAQTYRVTGMQFRMLISFACKHDHLIQQH
jgi:hypothetical protein